jgi:hypothetical protein
MRYPFIPKLFQIVWHPNNLVKSFFLKRKKYGESAKRGIMLVMEAPIERFELACSLWQIGHKTGSYSGGAFFRNRL